MRRHIFAWLGVAVIAMIVGTWSLSSAAEPGEEVPDSIADSLRGGDCFAGTIAETCVNPTKTMYCDTGNTMKCKAGAWRSFTAIVPNGVKPKGTNYCCGTTLTSCGAVSPDKQNCGTGPVANPVPVTP